MTQSEKLQKVIERAVKNGWEDQYAPNNITVRYCEYLIDEYEIENIFFSHEFAKAFFEDDSEGENDTCYKGHTVRSGKYRQCQDFHEITCQRWQYCLQQLALTPPSERIDYLFSFIENEN